MGIDSSIRLKQLNQTELSGFVSQIASGIATGIPTGKLTGVFYPLYDNPNAYLQYSTSISQIDLDSSVAQQKVYNSQTYYPLTNPSGFIVMNSNLVTTGTTQTINGSKSFLQPVYLYNDVVGPLDVFGSSTWMVYGTTGKIMATMITTKTNGVMMSGNNFSAQQALFNTITGTDVSISTYRPSSYCATQNINLMNGLEQYSIYLMSGNGLNAILPDVKSQRQLVFKQIVSGVSYLNGRNSDVIDGASSYLLSGKYSYITLYSDGQYWHRIG